MITFDGIKDKLPKAMQLEVEEQMLDGYEISKLAENGDIEMKKLVSMSSSRVVLHILLFMTGVGLFYILIFPSILKNMFHGEEYKLKLSLNDGEIDIRML